VAVSTVGLKNHNHPSRSGPQKSRQTVTGKKSTNVWGKKTGGKKQRPFETVWHITSIRKKIGRAGPLVQQGTQKTLAGPKYEGEVYWEGTKIQLRLSTRVGRKAGSNMACQDQSGAGT